MATYLIRANTILKQLDLFISLFTAMTTQQQTIANSQASSGSAALLKQMQAAQTVVEDRRRDLRDSLKRRAIDRFIHELWSLGGDMPHFDFDVSHLVRADEFQHMRDDISMNALLLTKDLSSPGAATDLATELSQSP